MMMGRRQGQQLRLRIVLKTWSLLLFAMTGNVHSERRTHKILLLGDSWADHGAQDYGKLFDQACDHYEGNIIVANEAISGSTAQEWDPSTGNNRLGGVLERHEDADAVWISLGGTEIFKGNSDCNQLDIALIGSRVWVTVMAVHQQLPGVKILLTGYAVSPACASELGSCVLDHLVELNTYLATMVEEYTNANKNSKKHLFLTDAMTHLDSGGGNPNRLWEWDCIHLNPEGHALLFTDRVIQQALCPEQEK